MKTLIIPAAGRGKRMSDFYFPKCLLAVHQRPLLFQIIDSWADYIDEVVIVLNTETGKIIEEFVSKYFSNKNINIIYCYQKEVSGTYFAVSEAIKNSKNKEYILNWSDILISPKMKNAHIMNISDKNIIFTTGKKSCRWGVENDVFVNRGPYIIRDGGIYGVFVINRMNGEFFSAKKNESGQEIEILEMLDPSAFIELKYEGFIDVGDDGKYTTDVRSADEDTRAYGSFNDMAIYENLIVKNTGDSKLKRCESNWYKNADFNFVPKVLCYDPLILERVKDSMNVARRLVSEGKGFEEFVVSNMFKILEKIHTSKGVVDAEGSSSYDQYIGKTIKRMEKVDFLFSGFNYKNIKINGKEYKNPLIVIRENEHKIKDIFAKKFRFIHGDLQTSNALITKDNKIYVIDPRGYFGNTELFGDPIYDFAKLYYGFCGMWEKFRSGESKFRIIDGGGFEIVPLLEESALARRRELFFKYAKQITYDDVSKRKVDIIHAIIWLSVCDYIANDLLSSMYAYLYGTVLINEVFKDEEI
jgi:GTP:adenosylcobinamide-phosphate guanylyltransferase